MSTLPNSDPTPTSLSLPLSVEICTVGTELLLGDIVDTNAAYLARRLAGIGVNVFYRSGVGDNLDRICEVIDGALSRSDAVVLTGGLGPTQDDLTAEALSRVFAAPLEVHEETAARIRSRVERLNLKVAESTYRMAKIPAGAEALPNRVGQAPGIWIERAGKLAIALPGVPSEMMDIMEHEALPRIGRLPGHSSILQSRVLRLVGISESLAEENILDLIQGQTNPTIAPYAGKGELRLRITARAADAQAAESLLSQTEGAIRLRLGAYIYGTDEESLQAAVARLLLEQQQTIATAESCTAGLVAAALTETPGSSAYLLGGEIVYSNEAKSQILGVSEAVLEAHGAVSVEAAGAMASGVRRLHGVDIGVSVTGIAGPGGGSEAKPVGLVYIGVADRNGIQIEERRFAGTRADVRARSVVAALQILFRRLTLS